MSYGKTEYTIRMNYEAALSQAKALEEIAGKLLIFSQKELAEHLRMIRSQWTGSNGVMYTKKAVLVQKNMKEEAFRLKVEAGRIQKIAADIYAAEMQSLMLLK